jgi:hypothetical protein
MNKSMLSLLASNPVPAQEQVRKATFCQMHVTEPMSDQPASILISRKSLSFLTITFSSVERRNRGEAKIVRSIRTCEKVRDCCLRRYAWFCFHPG